MHTLPTFSVVTLGYKSVENIKRVIQQAQNSTCPPQEIIVLINFFEDAATQAIVDYVSSQPKITRWVYFSQNTGVGFPWNMGMQLATQDIVVVLNDDCSIGTHTYENILRGFDETNTGIVGVKRGGLPDDARVTAQGFLLAFKRSMIKKIGGYSEMSFPLACERELGLRAWSYGFATNFVEAEWSHVHDISNHPNTVLEILGEKYIPEEFQKKTQPLLDEQCRRYNQMLKVQRS